MSAGSTLSGLDMAAKEEELRRNKDAAEKKKEEKSEKPVRRSNSFSRRKKKTTTEETTAEEEGAAPTESKQPVVKVEEQVDPLCEALQKEAMELDAAGDYDAAGEKWYYLAEAAHNSGDLRREALAMQNMGTSLVNLGQLEQAFACYDRALQLADQAQDTLAQVDALGMLKWLFNEVGAFSNACKCLEDVVQLLLKAGETSALAPNLLELGQLYARMDEFELAVERFEEAHKMALEHKPDDSKLQAYIQLELAQSALELNDVDAALGAHEMALKAAEASADSEYQLRTRHDYAMMLLHVLHRDDAAQKLLHEMVDVARVAADTAEKGSQAAMTAMEMEGRACIELCPLLMRKRELEAAQALALRGIELAKGLDIDEAVGVCSTQMGDCLLASGKPEEAFERLTEARVLWRQLCNELHADFVTQQRRSDVFVRDNVDLQSLLDQSAKDTYIKLASATVRATGVDDPERAALFAVEEGRGVAYTQMITTGAPPQPPQLPPEEPSDEAVEPTPAVLPELPPPFGASNLQTLLTQLYGEGAGPEAGAIVYWSADASPTESKSSAEEEESPSDLLAWVITADGKVAMHKARNVTPDGEPLSELVWGMMEKLRLMAHSLPKRGIEVQEEMLADLRERHPEVGEGEVDISSELKKLADVVLAPLLPLLPEGAPLTLVPHSYLHLIPFAALPLPSGQPLVTAHALSQVASLKVLECMATVDAKAADMPERQGALILCAPETAEDDLLPAIPAAAAEAEAIGPLLHASPELVLTGKAATLDALYDGLKSPLATVHISAHMPQRYVVLAPKPPSRRAIPQEVSEDGTVEGEGEEEEEEPSSWVERTLDADKVKALWLPSHPDVVLGGSYGGTGALSQDGILGLPRAFISAGARSVLASLWDAVDEPTSLFLQTYYSHAQAGGAEALRRAALAFREADGAKYTHPLYWAGFVYNGVAK